MPNLNYAELQNREGQLHGVRATFPGCVVIGSTVNS